MAPGSGIVSTLAPGSAFTGLCPTCIVGGAYIRAGGTSMAAPVVSGLVAIMLQKSPSLTPDQVKQMLIAGGRAVTGGIPEVNAVGTYYAGVPTPARAAQPYEPNALVDRATGAIDYTRSSWSRSSWSSAPDSLVAGFARSSWSCACGASTASADSIDPTRSSWSRSSWSTKWSY
jgi:serine protease AprX